MHHQLEECSRPSSGHHIYDMRIPLTKRSIDRLIVESTSRGKQQIAFISIVLDYIYRMHRKWAIWKFQRAKGELKEVLEQRKVKFCGQ